jgi:hypothetical protein
LAPPLGFDEVRSGLESRRQLVGLAGSVSLVLASRIARAATESYGERGGGSR